MISHKGKGIVRIQVELLASGTKFTSQLFPWFYTVLYFQHGRGITGNLDKYAWNEFLLENLDSVKLHFF